MTAIRAVTKDSLVTTNGPRSEKNAARFEKTDGAPLSRRIGEVVEILATARARRIREATASRVNDGGPTRVQP